MEIYCPAKQVSVCVSGGGGGEGSGANWCEDVHSGEDPHSKSPSYTLVHVNVLCFTEEVFLKVDFYHDSRKKPPKFEYTATRVVFLLSTTLPSSTDNTTRPAGWSKSNWVETVQNLLSQDNNKVPIPAFVSLFFKKLLDLS